MQNNKTRVKVLDKNTGCINTASILFAEPDDEYEFGWLYLVADDAELNTNYEPMTNCNIWCVIASNADNYCVITDDDESVTF